VTSLYTGKCFTSRRYNTAPSRYHATRQKLSASDRMVVTFGDGWYRSLAHRICTCCQYAEVSLRYSRIASTKSPSLFMTTFSVSLSIFTALLAQSHDNTYYVSRGILAIPPTSLQKHTDLRTHRFESSADLWRQIGLLTLPAPVAGDCV
jgi:hypothetical protein